MYADAAAVTSRGAALGPLPHTATPTHANRQGPPPARSRAFIPLHDSSTSTALATSREPHMSSHTTASSYSASLSASSVEPVTPVNCLSHWARRREEEQRRKEGTQKGTTSADAEGPPAISVAKLLLHTSSLSSSHNSHPHTRRADPRGITPPSTDARGVAQTTARVANPEGREANRSLMGMTPSRIYEEEEEQEQEEEERVSHVEVVPRAAHVSAVPTARLSLAKSSVDADTSRKSSTAAEAGARQARDADTNEQDITVETSDVSESDVAERVLTTLQEKDKLIASLTTALHESEADRRLLRQEHARWQAEEAERRAQYTDTDVTSTVRFTTTTTPPPTPPPVHSISPGTHAAVLTRLADAEARHHQLQEALAKKEATVQTLRENLTEAQQGWELQQVSSRAAQDQIRILEQRVRQLQQQLEETQGDKREDIATLRAHITQLQSQLDERSREVKEKEKTHKRELTGLHKEMEALNAQFDAQLDAIESKKALQEHLTKAQQDVQHAHQEMARVQSEWEAKWRSSQSQCATEKRLKDELTQEKAALAREKSALREAVDSAEHELECTRRDLAELREAHATVHEEVAALRMTLQRQSSAAAEAALQSTKAAARERELRQQIATLEASLASAHELVQKAEEEREALREANAQQVTSLIADEQTKQAEVVEHVRGCAESAKQMEAAVVEAEARRRRAEEALSRAHEEVRAAEEKANRTAIQAQKDALEYQELATSLTAFHREKLAETLDALTALEATHAAAEADLREARQQLTQASAALSQTKDALEEAQEAKSQLSRTLDARTAALIAAKTQLKKALKVQLTLSRAKAELGERLKQSEAQRRACTEDAQTRLLKEKELWAAVGELATVLHTAEVSRATRATTIEKTEPRQEPQPHTKHLLRSSRGTTPSTARAPAANGGADISLETLVDRTRALQWWCVAQEVPAVDAHAEVGALPTEDDEVDEEGDSSWCSSELSSPSSLSSADVVAVVDVSVTNEDKANSTNAGSCAPTRRARATSSRTAVMSSASCSRPRRMKGLETHARNRAHATTLPSPSSSKKTTASAARPTLLPMPPLADVLRALIGPLRLLHRDLGVCQQALAASRASVVSLEDEKVRLTREASSLARQHQRDKEDACEQLRAALHRAEVDHHKAIAAMDARHAREMQQRVHEVVDRNREAAAVSEAAEKRVRLDRCARVVEELMDFIVRMPILLENYQNAVCRAALPAQSTAVDRAAAMVAVCPPEGEVLEPPRGDLRALCDDISRELLGLDGGWQDLAALCARQDQSCSATLEGSLLYPHSAEKDVATRARVSASHEWSWPRAVLADVEEALVRYLAERLHCAPSPSSEVAARTPFSRATTTSAYPAHDPRVSSASTPPQSLANRIRSWADSLRRADNKDGAVGQRDTAAAIRGITDEGKPVSDMMLSHLLGTCLEYTVDHIIQ